MCVKEWIIKKMIRYPFRFTLAIAVSLYVFAYLFLGFLRLADYLSQGKEVGWLGRFTQLSQGVESWYTFFGSYFGVIATVILGIVALRLDIKIQRISRESEINGLTVSQIKLYDLWRDYVPSVLRGGDISGRFILKLSFDKFDPYYDIAIEKAEWGLLKSDYLPDECYELDTVSVQIKARKQLEIYLNFDDLKVPNSKETMNYFYRIQCFEPIMMKPYERQRCLKLELRLKKMLYGSQTEDIRANLEITVENGNYQDGCVMLEEKNSMLTVLET